MTPEWERAAEAGDAATLEARIAGGEDVDSRDRFGRTALMIAAQHGRDDAVRALVRAGASLDVTAKYGLSATMLAVVNDHAGVALDLAEAGANLRLTGSGAPGFAGKTAADLARDRGLHDLAATLAPQGTDERGDR